MAFAWSINPYKGCVHGCHYCFARRYHSFIDLDVGDDFTGIILVRVNAPEVLRRELAKRSWKREMVALGTATDPYQPIEGKYRLTRGILEALRDFRTPVSIITKGSMVVRDIDVLADLQQRAAPSALAPPPSTKTPGGGWSPGRRHPFSACAPCSVLRRRA